MAAWLICRLFPRVLKDKALALSYHDWPAGRQRVLDVWHNSESKNIWQGLIQQLTEPLYFIYTSTVTFENKTLSNKIVSILKIETESRSEECFPTTPAQAHLQTTANREERPRSLMHVIKSQLSLSMRSHSFSRWFTDNMKTQTIIYWQIQEALKWLHAAHHFNSWAFSSVLSWLELNLSPWQLPGKSLSCARVYYAILRIH